MTDIKTGILFQILLLLAPVLSYSQNEADHLLEQIKTSNESDTDSLYYELYSLSRFDDPVKAEEYARKVYTISKKYEHRHMYVKSLHALGFIERRNNNLDQAMRYYEEGLDVALSIDYRIGVLMMLNNFGMIYYRLQQYDKAIEYYLKVVEYSRKYDEIYDEAIAYNNIASVYIILNNYAEALSYYLQCIQLKNKNSISEGLELNYCNAALCYVQMGEYEKAIDLLNNIPEDCKFCNASVKSFYHLGRGNAYYFLRDFDSAYENFSKALEISKIYNETNRIINSYQSISNILFEQNDLENSQKYLDSARNLSVESNDQINLMNSYNEYSKLYKAKGDLEQALLYKEKYTELKDSLFKEGLASEIKNSFLNFQQSQNDIVIQGKETQIKRNRQLIYFITIISTLLLVILFFAYRMLTVRRRLTEKLDSMVAAKTRELSHSNEQLIKSREELDTFLYRTSHDIRGPIATLMGLTNLAKIESIDNVTKNYLEKIDITASKLNEVITRLTNVSQINSQPLDIQTINTYYVVNEVIEEVRKNGNLNSPVHFRLNDNPPLELRTDKILFKIILTNLIENSFKFFDPKETEPYVALDIEVDGQLRFSISDNGYGIDSKYKEKIFGLFFVASEKSHGAGLGLYQVMLAIQKLNGSIYLESNRKPTRFLITIPVSDPA